MSSWYETWDKILRKFVYVPTQIHREWSSNSFLYQSNHGLPNQWRMRIDSVRAPTKQKETQYFRRWFIILLSQFWLSGRRIAATNELWGSNICRRITKIDPFTRHKEWRHCTSTYSDDMYLNDSKLWIEKLFDSLNLTTLTQQDVCITSLKAETGQSLWSESVSQSAVVHRQKRQMTGDWPSYSRRKTSKAVLAAWGASKGMMFFFLMCMRPTVVAGVVRFHGEDKAGSWRDIHSVRNGESGDDVVRSTEHRMATSDLVTVTSSYFITP